MKKFNVIFALCALVLVSFMSSCSDGSSNNNNSNQTILPEFNNQDGYFAAIQNLTTQTVAGFPVNITADFAVVSIIDNSTTSLDAGAITVNSNAMSQQSNNSYISGATTIDLGFNTSSGVSWNGAGGAGFAAFNYTTTNKMVGEFQVTGDYSTIDLSTALTVTINNFPTNATDILWQIVDGNGNIIQQMTTSGTSATFPTGDLAILEAGSNCLLQVAAYNFESSTINSKNLYFINETVVTQIVTLN